MQIREAGPADYDAIWEIFEIVVKSGDTYTFPPDTPKSDLQKFWFAPGMTSFVAEDNNVVVAAYFIKPNQPGLGAHICNCGYMVHPSRRGMGIGKLLCEHSLRFAKESGYTGMQYNIVVSTNTKAVDLWKRCGFRIIGTIPKGFHHQNLGYVDAFIMFRELD